MHPFDQIHGVETSGLIAAGNLITGHPNDSHVTAYYGVAPSILRTLIDLWRATGPPHPISHYTFLDIGAGKGRAILVASELPFHQVIGIELNPTLADTAQLNLDHWLATHAADITAPPLAPIRLYEQDALTFDLPRTPTLAFLFHPFEAPILKLLLRRIEARFAKKPGTPPPAFDLLYVNSECRRHPRPAPRLHTSLPRPCGHVPRRPRRRSRRHRPAKRLRLHRRRRVRHLPIHRPPLQVLIVHHLHRHLM